MKKILILANNGGGLYRFRRELIEELLKCYEVNISLPYGEFVHDMIGMGCLFHETKIDRRGMNPIKDVILFLYYIRLIRKVKPDVILSYTIKPNIYGGMVARLFKIPYMSNITGLGSAVERESILQTITLKLYRIALKKAACIFFQNQGNMNFMINHNVKGQNQVLVPGSGVNLDFYKPLPYPIESETNFVFISRVMKEKGIDLYLEAARVMVERYGNVKFHICGFCEEGYEEIVNKYVENGIVIYHGSIIDVREIHKISNCTVHPSYYPEGMSNVLLESAACGRPIITTPRPGCGEVVDDGYNGYIVAEKNPGDLITQIEKFISLDVESRKQMGMNGRNKVMKEFSREIVVNTYLERIQILANVEDKD